MTEKAKSKELALDALIGAFKLHRALVRATEDGTMDNLALFVHSDSINSICDATWQMCERFSVDVEIIE